MGRSGYAEDAGDCDNNAYLLWPSIVRRSLKGRRGQAFLQELAREMDAMPKKALIDGELVTETGACCAMGVICKARGIDVSNVDYDDREQVAKVLGIAPAMAGEIAYFNDDDFDHEAERKPGQISETPEERWIRMRQWVASKLEPPA